MKRQNHKSKLRRQRHGFTLAEVLLVLFIIVLIGTVGGGMCVGTYKRMLAERAAKDFAYAAKYARISAIERQSPCRMLLNPEENAFALLVYQFNEESGQTEQVPMRDLYFKKPVEFGGAVKFEGIKITPIGAEQVTEDEQPETIVFSPNGTASSAVVQIGDGTNHYTVSICAATGRAKMYVGEADEVASTTTDLDAR
jgi:prepilin-type N-terminal cleavage/methylation domain-containing protein